jgi:hypothetical protein
MRTEKEGKELVIAKETQKLNWYDMPTQPRADFVSTISCHNIARMMADI